MLGRCSRPGRLVSAPASALRSRRKPAVSNQARLSEIIDRLPLRNKVVSYYALRSYRLAVPHLRFEFRSQGGIFRLLPKHCVPRNGFSARNLAAFVQIHLYSYFSTYV